MIKLFAIPTGNFMLDGGAMFGVVPKLIWQKFYPADENNMLNICMKSLLIDDGQRRVLIDTGIGDKQDAKFFSYYYLNGEDSLQKSLSDNNYFYEDITDVVLTHLHFDHCGGAVHRDAETGKLIPAFPNAQYWISQSHWDLAMNPNKREAPSLLHDNFLPLLEHKKLRFIENDFQLTANIQLRLFHGHTEGQIIPFIFNGEKTLVFCADLIPAMFQIPPHYICAYDTRPLLSMDEKEAFLNEALEKNYILFFEHDLLNECCTLKSTAKGIREDKVGLLTDFFNM